MKGELDSNTITVGGFSTPFTSVDKSSRQKISKETLALDDTLDQMNLTKYLKNTFRGIRPGHLFVQYVLLPLRVRSCLSYLPLNLLCLE